MRVRVRVRVRKSVCVCVCACMRACVCVCIGGWCLTAKTQNIATDTILTPLSAAELNLHAQVYFLSMTMAVIHLPISYSECLR